MQKLLIAALLVLTAGAAGAQTPASDPSARLEAVLPPDIAAQVLEHIARARARELPAQALEHRALEMAAKGAPAAHIERAVARHARALESARDALQSGRRSPPRDAEVIAGADVIARGVDGGDVAELARTAPADRPIAVALYVLGALTQRGLATETALDRVTQALARRATDAEIEAQVREMPVVVAEHRAAVTGPGAGAANRPAFAGPPAAIPANPGAGAVPPVMPPGRGGPPMP